MKSFFFHIFHFHTISSLWYARIQPHVVVVVVFVALVASAFSILGGVCIFFLLISLFFPSSGGIFDFNLENVLGLRKINRLMKVYEKV